LTTIQAVHDSKLSFVRLIFVSTAEARPRYCAPVAAPVRLPKYKGSLVPSRSSRSSLPRRRRSRPRSHLPLLLPLSRRDGAPAGPQRGHLDALRVARAAAPPVCGAATRTAPRRWLPPSTAQRQGRRRGPPLAVVAASPAAAGSRRSSLLAVCLCWSKP